MNFSEINKEGQSEIKPQVPASGESKDAPYSCVLSFFIRFFGVVLIFGGALCAFLDGNSGHSDMALCAIYLISGIFAGLLCFALAVIVDACQLYRIINS